ncbi:MAG: type IV toxin-antitoxin system AbiEi family antitoxin domain-containing protein [Bacteroidota bacterium]
MTNNNHHHLVFKKIGPIATAKELLAGGLTYYELRKLLAAGKVTKLKRGLYRWREAEISEMGEVDRAVGKGVFCLYSAAFHHQLTTFVPSDYHLAVPKKYKVVLPDYPPVKLYYWLEESYVSGTMRVEVEGSLVSIYDPEKTVCDFFRYRKQVGTDLLKEVVTTYLARDDRNLSKLSRYATALKVGKIVREYLTMLL